VDETLERAWDKGDLPLKGYYNTKDFMLSIKKSWLVIILIKVRAPVD
jgi:hypothetical protein